MNSDVDPNQKIQVVDLSGAKPLKISGREAKAFIKRWKGAPLEIGADPNGKIIVRLSTIDPDHPFWSSDFQG
ncbi:MAG: hypothetical protein FWF31_08200 [Desulfobulbus sp.]|nr:hypothetical protein [Desulfobulbus sp.]